MTERVLISALIRAFSPTVRDPSESMLPSIFPSTTKSFEKRILPLISTSELRTFRPLGLGELVRCGELDELLAAGALEGLSVFEGPVDEFSDSGFWPITFWNTVDNGWLLCE